MPSFEEITRVSATEISINWTAIEGEPVTYFVRYQEIHDMGNASVVEVETTETWYFISELNPGLSYAVSVAAENREGRGNFSEEITVGCRLKQLL